MGRTLLVFLIPFVLSGCLGSRQEESFGPHPDSPRFYRTFPEVTSNSHVVLEGSSEGSVRIEIFRSGILVAKTLANKQGEFRTPRISLKKGDNRFYAVAIDQQGRRSPRGSLSRRRGRESGRLPLEIVVTQE